MAGWQDLPKGQRLGVLIGVPVLIAAGFGYLAYQDLGTLGADPMLKQYASFLVPGKKRQSGSLWTKIEAKKADYQKEKLVADQLPEVEEELAKVKARREELRSRLPSEKQKTEVRVLIEEMANQITEDIGRIEFRSVKIDEKSGQGGRARGSQQAIEEVVYRCELEADMNGLIYYINRLENSTRFMALDNLKMKPGKPYIDDETVEVAYEMHGVSMSIKTYVYAEEE